MVEQQSQRADYLGLHRRVGPLVHQVVGRFRPVEQVQCVRQAAALQANNLCRNLASLTALKSLHHLPAGTTERPSVDAQVLGASSAWRAVRTVTGSYEAVAAKTQQPEEFLHLLLVAVGQRRVLRRYLWRRFGFDAVRRRYRRRSQPVSDPAPAVLLANATLVWARAERVFLEGATALLAAHAEQQTLAAAVARAGAAMRMEWLQSGGLLVAALMRSTHVELREHATFTMAGWAAANLRSRPRGDGRDNLRLYRALVAADDDPARALRERLPGTLPLAWAERRPGEPLAGNRGTDGERLRGGDHSLLNRVARWLEAEGREHHTSSLRPAVVADRTAADVVDDFERAESARRQLARLAEAAGLSPRERAVFALMRETDRPVVIAQQLGIAEGTAKALTHRVRVKLKRARLAG